MASIRSSTYKNHLWLTFDYDVSQDIAQNQSTIRWDLVLHWDALLNFSASKKYSINVSNTAYSGSYTGGATGQSGNQIIKSGSTIIKHNDDGTKSISVSANFDIGVTYSDTWISTMKLSGSIALPMIPRITTPTLSASSVAFGKTVTIRTPRASTGFTHTLQMNFMNGKWEDIAKNVATSYLWTVPSSLMSRIPNATSGKMQLKCITYYGSKRIGEKIISLTVTVPDTVKPTVQEPLICEAVSNIYEQFGVYVKGKSQVQVSISAAGAQGSTIMNYTTTLSGVGKYSGQTFTSGILGNAGTVTITTTVTDSRGRTASAESTFEVVDYHSPIINKFEVQRCTKSGIIDEDAGIYAKMTYAFEISSVKSKNRNTFELQYLNDSGLWSTLKSGTGYLVNTYYITATTFNVNKDREFRLKVSDYFGTWYAYCTMLPTFTLVNFSQDGKGIAFGTTAKSQEMNSVLPFTAPQISSDAFFVDGHLLSDWNQGLRLGYGTLEAGHQTSLFGKDVMINTDYGSYSLGYQTSDSPWIKVTYGSGISTYNGYADVRVKRFGKVVQMRGHVTNSTSWTTLKTIFTVPEGFRPSSQVSIVQQGSGSNRWVLLVRLDGTCTADRYSNNTTMSNTVPTGSWLCVQATWIID